MKKFYRYHDYPSFSHSGRRVELEVWISIKETPCGHWIIPADSVSYSYDNVLDDTAYIDEVKKWVGNNGRKRFAYPTKDEALKGFIARKKRQIELTEAKLRGAKSALAEGEIIRNELASEFDDKQLKKCKHALGIDRSHMMSYRNYYNSGRIPDKDLDKLVELGLMSKRETSQEMGGIYYHMTDKGIDRLQKITGGFKVKHD